MDVISGSECEETWYFFLTSLFFLSVANENSGNAETLLELVLDELVGAL